MTRHDLPRLIADDGIGVELGVAAGHYSKSILDNSDIKTLYSIDRWTDHHDHREYLDCINKLTLYGHRSIIVRKDFDKALTDFNDNYFDFIYIDAYAHDGQQGGKLLYDWWSKLKSGGIFSGHDYHTDFPLTIKAVDDFCNEMGYTPIIIDGHHSDGSQEKYQSWYIIKE